MAVNLLKFNDWNFLKLILFSSVQLLSHVWPCNPMDCRIPGFIVFHKLLELAQTHLHWVGDAIQISHPLLTLSPAFNLSQHQGLFQWLSSSHQVAKVNVSFYKCLLLSTWSESGTMLVFHTSSTTVNGLGKSPHQSWIFIGTTDAEAEAPILWPLDAKNWLIGKDPDAGKDWRQEKGMTEDEIFGWHHRLDGHKFEQALGVGDGQGRLACCSPWHRKELAMTE